MSFAKGELHTDFHISFLTLSPLLCFPPPTSSSGEDEDEIFLLQNISKMFLLFFASQHPHHPQVKIKVSQSQY